MNRSIVLLAGAVVVLAVAAVLLRGTWGNGERDDAVSPAPAESPAGGDAGGAGDAQGPTAALRDEEPAGAQPAGEPESATPETSPESGADPGVGQGLGEHEIRLQGFADQYGHLSVPELRAVLAERETEIQTVQRALFEERFAQGLYDIVLPGDPPPPPLEPDASGRVPVQSSRAFTDPSTAASESHVSQLPIAEYPDFYALLDERDWLKAAID